MDPQDLFLTALRALLVYVVMLGAIRLLGKRTIGNASGTSRTRCRTPSDGLEERLFLAAGLTRPKGDPLAHYARGVGVDICWPKPQPR